MSAASDLIERVEQETGQRIDADSSMAMAGLFGALSRALGQPPPAYKACDDVAAGVLIQHQMTPEYCREQDVKQLLTSLLVGGVSPDDAKILLG